MGLIGKNGAGKSTTLKAILNMVSSESGSVSMFQKDFYQHERECKQRIGVVFGGIDFYPLKMCIRDRDIGVHNRKEVVSMSKRNEVRLHAKPVDCDVCME